MRFEGVGRKTAERLAFNLLSHWNENALSEFVDVLTSLKNKLVICPSCFSYIESTVCPFCNESRMKNSALCIVAQARDVYLIESTEMHKGGYFVLGNLLSPLDGRGLSLERKESLLSLIQKNNVKEAIVALDSSIEGEATSLYLRQLLSPYSVSLTKLASGLPMGSQIDFVDRGTLSEALRGRQNF
jgi:recombination protein RecR